MKLDNLHIINFEGCSEFRVQSSEFRVIYILSFMSHIAKRIAGHNMDFYRIPNRLIYLKNQLLYLKYIR